MFEEGPVVSFTSDLVWVHGLEGAGLGLRLGGAV